MPTFQRALTTKEGTKLTVGDIDKIALEIIQNHLTGLSNDAADFCLVRAKALLPENSYVLSLSVDNTIHQTS